ncbi:3-methyladenine DNA glycosylase [Aspergillus wentii]|nr:3-methyladenine DNA glycosylase [Aspergillus wentii]
MALRRSSRLSAIPNGSKVMPLQPITGPKKPSRAQHSGVSKTRKVYANGNARGKKTTTPTVEKTAPETQTAVDNGSGSERNQDSNDINPFSTDSAINRQLRATPPPLDRPVEPHRTNATLLTPHGSSVVAYPPGSADISPSKTGRPRPTATTGTLLEKANAYLIAADARLKPVIENNHCKLFSPEGLAEEVDPFKSLVVSIIGQQVSGAAAKSIRDRFVALFNKSEGDDVTASVSGTSKTTERFPTPEEISQCEILTLRTAGLSQRKAEYIQGLSQKFADGELSARMLVNASDDELVEKLIAVRGLGKWSVEMFACFALKRTDVFSTGDLGVQRGCAAFIGKDVSKLKAKGGGKFKYMPEKDMVELAAKFSPYRSLFMWYMWRVENVDVAVLNA